MKLHEKNTRCDEFSLERILVDVRIKCPVDLVVGESEGNTTNRVFLCSYRYVLFFIVAGMGMNL